MMAVNGKRLSDREHVWVDRSTGEVINIDYAWQKSDQRIALRRREQAMLAAAGMDGPEARWYVLRVEDRADIAVDKLLGEARVERWMAVKEIEVRRRSRNKTAKAAMELKPALPGYLFVKVVSCDATWAGLQTVKGVIDVLGGYSNPKPVKQSEILKLQAYIENDPDAIAMLTNALKLGDKVSIDFGPFASFEAIVSMLGDANRIKVEVDVFGRAVPVDLDLAQVTKLE